jgi:hypothetical protein
MYVIIGSYFVPLEGKFLLIALVIVRITLNTIIVIFFMSMIHDSVNVLQIHQCWIQ